MQIELLDEPTSVGFAPNGVKSPKYVSLGEYERVRNGKNRQESLEITDGRAFELSNEQESPCDADALDHSVGCDAIQARGNIDVKNIVPTISSSSAVVDWQAAVPALKEKEKSRLQLLGLSAEDMGFFVTTFIGHRWQFIQRTPEGAWFSVKERYLDDWTLVRHLAGDIVVGSGCRWDTARRDFRTTYVVIDLDHQGDDQDLRDRYERARKALGRPSYVIRSSGSGGLHVYYLLTRSEPLHALRTSSGLNGDVVRLLEAAGLRQANGQVEVYPRGHYIDGRGQQARVRAPFGSGSCLLHPETLEPLALPGPRSLILAREMFERGQVGLIDPASWFENRQALPTVATKPPARAEKVARGSSRARRSRPKPSSRLRTRNDPEKVHKLLTEGLTSRKQFNDAVVAIAFHFRNDLGLSKGEANVRLLDWLESRHNGKSGTYNQDPARARSEVHDILSRVYGRERRTTRPAPKNHFVSLPALSEYEATTILKSFEKESDSCDPSSGEVLDWYKLLRFAFELLRLAKQYVLSFIAKCLKSSPSGEVSDSDLAEVWPDRSKPEFIVACPASLRDGRGRTGNGFLKGIGRDTRWKLWRAIRHSGLFREHRPACSLEWARRPATYVVRLDFGALSHSLASFAAIEPALTALSPAETRNRRLTRYRRQRIATAAVPVLPSDRQSDQISRYLERKLADREAQERGSHAS